MTDWNSLKGRLFDVEADVVALHPIAGLASECIPDWVDELSERIEPDSEILKQLPGLSELLDDQCYPSPDNLCDFFFESDRQGFVVYAQWCSRRYLPGGGFMSGPGVRRTVWLYAETVEAAFEAVIAAAGADHEKQRAKAGSDCHGRRNHHICASGKKRISLGVYLESACQARIWG